MLSRISRLWRKQPQSTAEKKILLYTMPYQFFPADASIAKINNLNSSETTHSLSAYEVSCWLHQLARTTLSTREALPELTAHVEAVNQGSAFTRLYKSFTDATYCRGLTAHADLQSFDRHAQLCLNTLGKLLALNADVPVATASNTLYAAAHLGLDVQPHLEQLIKLVEQKLGYLNFLGIAETAWALETLGVKNEQLMNTLKEECRKRDIEGDPVVPSRWNHLQYDEPEGLSEISS